MAASSVANLSVKLTANTARFSADMAKSARSLNTIRSAAVTAQRGIRLVFGGLAVVGLVRALSSAVAKAKEFRVIVNTNTSRSIDRLVRSYQAFGNAATRVVLKILAVAAPTLERIIDMLTSVSLWIETKISPQTVNLAKNIITLAGAAVAAYGAFKLVVAIQTLWNAKTKIAVVLQTALAALTGNWVGIAAAIVAATGATVAISAAFGKFGDDSSKDVKGVRSEVDKLKQSMLGLQDIGIGRIGRDFMPRSSLSQSSELGKYLSSQESMVDEVRRVNQQLARTRAEQADRANSRYMHHGTGKILY